MRISEDGKVQTLTGKMGTGGGNVPLLLDEQPTLSFHITQDPVSMEDKTPCITSGNPRKGQATVGILVRPVIPIADKATRHKGGGPTRSGDGAGNGLGIGEPDAPGYTLTAADRHAVAYAIQGNMIGRADKNGPQGSGINEEVSFTLNTADKHAVAYSLDKAAYNQGENSSYGIGVQEEKSHTITAGWQPPVVAYDCRNHTANEEISGTLQAKSNGGQSLNYINPVAFPAISGTLTAKMAKGTGGPAGDEAQNLVTELPEYIVRRLTPTECGRLQGFPDEWTQGLAIGEPDDETVSRWEEIFETHRKLTGQPKTRRKRSQIIRWLKNPQSDTALYKMWGNGLALPCAAYVMEGIAEVLNREEAEE